MQYNIQRGYINSCHGVTSVHSTRAPFMVGTCTVEPQRMQSVTRYTSGGGGVGMRMRIAHAH